MSLGVNNIITWMILSTKIIALIFLLVASNYVVVPGTSIELDESKNESITYDKREGYNHSPIKLSDAAIKAK
jgi:hypothetical protein